MEIVKMVNLKKYYNTGNCEVRALDGVTLSVEEGEFVAIVGTSGSGKTTLLNLIGGLDTPTGGGVWIRGSSLKDMNEEERTIFRRRNIGFVFRLDSSPVDEELFEKVVNVLRLEDKLERLPQMLSGGQQQRVAIARALLAKPAIMLCDEPTGNLDSVNSMEVVELLKSCARQFQQTVVLVTHQEDIAKKADRVIRMEDGKIKEDRVVKE